MRQPQVLPRQMGGDLAAHQMACRVLDERQPFDPATKRRDGHEGFRQDRMHFAPAFNPTFSALIGGHNHIQGARFQLVKQPVACAGFKQETASAQVVSKGRQQSGRHLGVEILDHAKAQGGQAGQVSYGQIGAGLGLGVQDGLGVAAKHSAGRG